MPVTIKITINSDALKLLGDFIKYGKSDQEAMADAMMYDVDGFKSRLKGLEVALSEAGYSGLPGLKQDGGIL